MTAFLFNHRISESRYSITPKCPGKQICDCVSYDIMISCTVRSKVSSSWICNGTCISYDVMYSSVKWTSATCGQVRYPRHRRWTVAGGQGVGCFQIQHRHLIHWKKTPRHFCYKISSTGNKNCCTCTSICLCPWRFHLALMIQSGERVLNALIQKSGNISQDTAQFFSYSW